MNSDQKPNDNEFAAGHEKDIGTRPPVDDRGGEVGESIEGQAIINKATATTVPLRELSGSPTGAEPPRYAAPPANLFRLTMALPNVAGGKAYEAAVRVGLKPPTIPGVATAGYRLSVLSIDGLTDTGLEHDIDGDHVRIHGKTSLAGDRQLRVFFRVQHPDLPSIDGHDDITLTVNPDPRSLWKELEPDVTLPFPKPHSACRRLASSKAVLIAASQRGRSHAHEGSFRDDDFGIGFDQPTGWHYMVVADGAGSAKLSRQGSAVACEAVHEPLLTHFRSTLAASFTEAVLRYRLNRDSSAEQSIRRALYTSLGAAALAARKAVEGEAAAHGGNLRDFSTTFLLVICRQFDVGWFAAAFSIGDGGVAVYSTTAGVTPLSQADSGEFAGQTRFLTMSEIWQGSKDISDRIGFHLASDLTAIVAMTDGVSDPKFETDAKFSDTACWHAFWKDLIGNGFQPHSEHADKQILDWLGFWSVGNHDDRTLAVLVPA